MIIILFYVKKGCRFCVVQVTNLNQVGVGFRDILKIAQIIDFNNYPEFVE